MGFRFSKLFVRVACFLEGEMSFLLTNLGKTLGMVWRSEFGPPS